MKWPSGKWTIKYNKIYLPPRSLYSGVYKLDVEEEPYSCVKKIFPTTTIKPVILPNDKHASLCNFIDLSENQQGESSPGFLNSQVQIHHKLTDLLY